MIADALADLIRRDGPLTVAAYMDAVAQAYYGRGDVFGSEGDFITAPEISQTFGELIGLWCAVVWRNMGAPKSFALVECGPGRGTLMSDLLRAAARVPGFTAAASIHLVERSAALQTQQRKKLEGREVTWHEDITALPEGPSILIANEFLDALPIHQFEKTAAGWAERHVALDERGGFGFILKPITLEHAPHAATGEIFEISPATIDVVTHIAARIAKYNGAALLIDYGHKRTAIGETLQAVKKHKPCGIFEVPGTADLTAHVDFDAVARAAGKAGAKVHGPLEQGAWLNRLGIKLRGLQLAKSKDAATARTIESGIRRLTEPDAMGVLFKVMALTHPALVTPDGFHQDAPA
jgi:NADH dehydrogenase [ubiquinone] 1 alpha subcomplex assembly factor 7